MSAGSSPFERLHPAVQYHVVNSLGWSSLRPTQSEAIVPILAGDDALLLAPTAGGKTEAAVLPLLSRMISASWTGLSVLYICPIKALLNNLEPRLARLLGLVGRQVGLWHGDVDAAARRRLLREPPDLLLITPESIEGLLTARDPSRRVLLESVQTLVVDELHAFAGDDRGWHLLALLNRLEDLAGRRLQRLGLSATVGNPEALLDWLTGGRGGRVIGRGGAIADAEVTIDHVGSLENAALVIARLHRGEKRLVFCDSRGRVETLAAALRSAGVQVFVSHSSVSSEARRQAERAFGESSDCVIVATSTLELGIDVGDLDRVIQIDAPATVSSFLQRMGRTGRRAGAVRHCLFLATSDESLLCAAGLALLWRDGYVEPIRPPPKPYQVVAQQIMARLLQQGGGERGRLAESIGRTFRDLPQGLVEALLSHMVREEILWEDGGVLWFAPKGEQTFGRRSFLELLSVFNSPLQIQVRHGTTEIGSVDPLSLRHEDDQPTRLQLAGRGWRVIAVDWARRIAAVEPSPEPGRSHWVGSPRALGFDLCRAVRSLLAGRDPDVRLSRRAQARLAELREEMAFVSDDGTTLVTHDSGDLRWWTFAGRGANAVLAQVLARSLGAVRRIDNFSLQIDSAHLSSTEILERLRASDIPEPVWEDWMAQVQLKFERCLPETLAHEVILARLTDLAGAVAAQHEPIRAVRTS
ncbi:MAG: DEAD/DEAH box helicase [Gammaproteobacteria bacterium]|nr:DEAD/DEAH box helicase [Gammaproteobacteria bacterium]